MNTNCNPPQPRKSPGRPVSVHDAKRTMVYLSQDLKERLKQHNAENGTSTSALVRKLLEGYLTQKGQ